MQKRKVEPAATSRHLVNQVAADLDCSLGEANRLIDAVIQAMALGLKRDEPVLIDGVCTLFPRLCPASIRHIENVPALKRLGLEPFWQPARRSFRITVRESLFKALNQESQ